jgi:OOP family OmpA-OmpF porin
MIAAAAVPLALAACSTAQDVGSSIGNTFSDGARVVGHGFRDVFTLARDDLDVLQQTQPRGSQFARALAEGYTGLAESERQQYDWVSSDRFAEKGLKAAQGTIVAPENPDDWGLNRNVRGEVAQTRQRLVNAIGAGSSTMPALAAKAQVSYDCWVEQLDEGWQTEHIAACRRNMMAALEGLERGRQTAAAQPVPQAAETRGPERYLVFFDWDKSHISPAARQVIGDAAQAVTRRNLDVVVVEGHADRSGSDDYNVRLSQRRADAVRQALVAQGIPANRIQTQAYGESQPLVQTEDGVRNPQNRRSSVIIETGPVAATPVERAPMDGAAPRLPGQG